jgi:outer membrane protein TolC
MNAARILQVWTAVVAFGAFGTLTTPASAQEPTPSPATPPAAQAAQQPVDRYIVGQARPPAEAGKQIRDLTLEEAMTIALEKNLGLQVAKMAPQSVDYQIQAARASFLPQFTSSYSYSNSKQPSNDSLDGVSSVTSVSQGYNGGMSQNLPWHGAQFGVNFNNSRSSTNRFTTRLNPGYNSSVRASFSMPLLQGFKIDGTRNQLRTLQVQRQISDIQLQSQIENLKNQVRTSYWNLRSAIEQIEIQRRALEIAQRQFEDSKIRVEIGTLAPIDTTQFETQVANAEQQLLNAQITWRTAELNFKTLLANGTEDDIFNLVVNPVEQPSLSVQSVDIQSAVTRALQERTDMMQARKQIESSQLSLEVTKNQTLPSLSLQSGYNLTGQGGTEKIFQGGQVVGTIPGGYADALAAIAGFDTPAWNFGFNFSYPLGMRAAKANYARAQLSLDQSQAQLKAQELSISTEVINAGLSVENTYKQYQAAQKSREAAEKNADAAVTRFDVGLATNFEVVQAQQQLTTSRLSELSALIRYMNAVAEFERVQKVGR